MLLGGQLREALAGFVRSVLGRLIDRDRTRGSDLVALVRAFTESGRSRAGGRDPGDPRHTLRYRMRQAEELLRRDLAWAEDRIEIWLALKVMEVLEGEGNHVAPLHLPVTHRPLEIQEVWHLS